MEENVTEKVIEIVNPIVEKEGFSLYDVEYDRRFLRIYIENPLGVSIDDCARISKIISTKLDEVDIIHHRYILEVSSPGVERKLKRKEHYEKSIGKMIKVYMKNKSVKKGYLIGVKDDSITIKGEEEISIIMFKDIKFGQVKVDTDKLFGRKR